MTSFSLTNIHSQCTVSIKSNGIDVDTIVINLGDYVDLYASANCYYHLGYEDFNSGTLDTGWYSNVIPLFNNPCPPLILPASGLTCWIGNSISGERYIKTPGYNFSIGCSSPMIEFDMKYGDDPGSTDCNNPDGAVEGIHLQFSVDGGLNWTDLNYWTPTNNISGPLYTWTHFMENIPPIALSANTSFRWRQEFNNGKDYDHWGIDNVDITQDCLSLVSWSTGETVLDPPPFYPSQTMDVTCTVMNTINGNFAIDTVHIIVNTSTAVEENQNDIFSIYPNPVSDVLKIKSNREKEKINIRIFNHLGCEVEYIPDFTGDILHVSKLNNGFYFLKYSNSEYFSVKKFIIQH